MKHIISIYIISFLGILIYSGCKQEVTNPEFSPTDVPRILINWQTTLTLRLGDSLKLDPQISPSDGATYKWELNGQEVSTDKSFRWKATEFGEYVLAFTVARNGITNSRTAQIAIQTATFKPKEYTKKVVGFITPGGKIEDIQWDKLTHLVISSVQVGANGVDTILNANDPKNLELQKIIFMAYNYGVYVSLDLTGIITNYTYGGGAYANYDFYNAIADETKRAKLISDVKLFWIHNKFDGLNVYLNNFSEGVAFQDVASVTQFFNDLHDALPDGPKGKAIYTASVQAGWTASVLSMVATNPNFDWIHVYGFASQDLTPVPSSPVWYFNDANSTWINMGVPAEKIIGGIPAFGRDYNFPTDVTINWGNVDNYASWISYKSILGLDANAPNLDPSQLNIHNGIFYEGFSNVDAKAQIVKDNNYGGLLLWSVENDSSDPSKSLLKRIYDDLNGSN
ncbi:MAG: glycosyl hydrolase family 18 protein [Prolixibacteraceae bacterium]|jgi:hypothetical protein